MTKNSWDKEMNSELLEFTRQALAKGVERPEIEETLRQAGWDATDVKAAIGSFADIKFPVPVPRPRPYLSAREVFIYLIMFAALYAAAYSLGSMAFHFIDRAFPDPAQTRQLNNFNAAVRWDVSSLLVAFPLFIFTFYSTNKAILANPTRRGSRPRKWLTYLTLFVASVALTGDVITLIYNVLGGEVTIRFVLKVATIAVIAGGVFTHFLTDVRKEEVP
jgi:membrane protein YqaA with SNARE-associated domain